MGWTPEQLPELQGKTYVITGGTSGLGLEAAKLLAARRARVVVTARDAAKAAQAEAAVREAVPGAEVAHVVLDLADLDSVDRGAEGLRAACPRLDALINNAGVMQPPLQRTKQGFELQFGTNHLGHFRLVSRLIDRIEASGGRVVPVASMAHEQGRIDLADPNYDAAGYDTCATNHGNFMDGEGGNDSLWFNQPEGTACPTIFIDPTSTGNGGADECGDSNDYDASLGELPLSCSTIDVEPARCDGAN